jgi:hypothetical protein
MSGSAGPQGISSEPTLFCGASAIPDGSARFRIGTQSLWLSSSTTYALDPWASSRRLRDPVESRGFCIVDARAYHRQANAQSRRQHAG